MCNTFRKWYVRFADSKRAVRVTYEEYRQLKDMGKYYKAIVSDNFHPNGKTLTLSFRQSFV